MTPRGFRDRVDDVVGRILTVLFAATLVIFCAAVMVRLAAFAVHYALQALR